MIAAAILTMALSADPWTWRDTALEAALGALFVIDSGQTNYNTRIPGGYETDIVLFGSRHPSKLRVDLTFAGQAVLHAAIAPLLDRPWREIWQSLFIGMELQSVAANAAIAAPTGLSLRLAF